MNCGGSEPYRPMVCRRRPTTPRARNPAPSPTRSASESDKGAPPGIRDDSGQFHHSSLRYASKIARKRRHPSNRRYGITSAVPSGLIGTNFPLARAHTFPPQWISPSQ